MITREEAASTLDEMERRIPRWSDYYDSDAPSADVLRDARAFIANLPELRGADSVTVAPDASGGVAVYFWSIRKHPGGGSRAWVFASFDNDGGRYVFIGASYLPLADDWREAASLFLENGP